MIVFRHTETNKEISFDNIEDARATILDNNSGTFVIARYNNYVYDTANMQPIVRHSRCVIELDFSPAYVFNNLTQEIQNGRQEKTSSNNRFRWQNHSGI